MAGQRWQKVFADFDGATPSFPTAALTPLEFFPRIAGVHSPAAITFTVPASAPYAVRLPRVASQGDVVVTVGGNSRATVLGESPASGQVGWDLATGKLTFNSSDAGGSASATLTNVLDTVISADFLHALQKEVAAVQTATLGIAAVDPEDGVFLVGDGDDFVGESGATVRASMGLSPDARTIHVSAASGSDVAGDGSAGAPLATFGAAYTAAVALEAACLIVLGPGAYTWTSEWEDETPEQPMPTAPIGIVGAGRGLTTLTLAKVGDWGRHDCSLLQGLAVTVGASTTARINRITGFDQVVRDCDFEATGSGSSLQFVVVSGSAALVMAGCRFADGGESYSVTMDSGAIVLGTEFLHEGNTTATTATVRDCEIAKPSGVVTLNSRSRLIGCRVEADRLAGSLLEMVGCRCLLGDMGIDVDPATSEPARITDNTILVTGDTAPARTFLLLVENASTERCVIARNEIVYEGDFEESGSGGHVAVIGREEFAGVLEISGNVIETTTIGLMDSHPANDSSRTTQVRPTTLVGNVIKCVLPAVDGPDDRKGCVVRYGGGAFFSQGNLFEMDSSANTATDFDHVCVWLNSTGLSGAYASSWTSMNDVFRITAASGSMDSGITKGVIRFDNTTNSPSAVAIRGALMDVSNTTTVVDTVGAGAPGAWFVGDWRLVSRSTGTTTQYVNAVAVGSWTAGGDLSMAAGADVVLGTGGRVLGQVGSAAEPSIMVGSRCGFYAVNASYGFSIDGVGRFALGTVDFTPLSNTYNLGRSDNNSYRFAGLYLRETSGAVYVGSTKVLDGLGVYAADLSVSGEVTSDLSMGAGAQVLADAGTASAVGLAFGSVNTGLYLYSTNRVAFTANGTIVGSWNTTGLSIHSGLQIGVAGSDWQSPARVSTTAAGSYYVGANQVVGARQSAISAPSGQANDLDAEARAAIGSILTALRTHGLIAT